MSRWTNNKKYYSSNGNNIWISTPNVYKVITDQGEIIHRMYGKLDYKQTVKNFYKAGYTNVSIVYLGRDVSI